MANKLTFWGAVGFVALYFVAVFAAEFIGFVHPVCWVLAPALGALLGALPYRWLSLRWRGMGLGTVLAAVFGLLMMAMGEVDLQRLGIIVGFGLLSDAARRIMSSKCVTRDSDFICYTILAMGDIALIIYLWTRKAWYLQGAAEEMGQAYADAMVPLQSGLWLVVALAAIIAAAIGGIYVAKRLLRGSKCLSE